MGKLKVGTVKLYDAGPGDPQDEEDAQPDAAIVFNPRNPSSAEMAREAIRLRYGVDLGPLLKTRTSWWSRLFSRRSSLLSAGAMASS